MVAAYSCTGRNATLSTAHPARFHLCVSPGPGAFPKNLPAALAMGHCKAFRLPRGAPRYRCGDSAT